MSLTKEDLQQFEKIIDHRANKTDEKLTKAIETIDEKIDFLAGITKKEFDIVHNEFAEVHKEFAEVHQEFAEVHKEISDIKVDIADHDFKMTELVPKVQHFYLEQRVCRLEEKAGIRREK